MHDTGAGGDEGAGNTVVVVYLVSCSYQIEVGMGQLEVDGARGRKTCDDDHFDNANSYLGAGLPAQTDQNPPHASLGAWNDRHSVLAILDL